MLYDNSQIVETKTLLVETIHFLHNKGWAPATSSNYSFRVPEHSLFWISQSGKDKGQFTEEDLMLIDETGQSAEDDTLKPSAETLLHTLLYKDENVNCVLHTHSVCNTLLSSEHAVEGKLILENYEVLKGLPGISTHETSYEIPIFHNSQDMHALSAEVEKYMATHPKCSGFLLAGHGLYTWGASIAEAKRHVEVFEFLFEVKVQQTIYRTALHGNSQYTR